MRVRDEPHRRTGRGGRAYRLWQPTYRSRREADLRRSGPLATANLLQRSGLIEQTIDARDSQTVFIPFAFGGARSAPSEPDYTLSQIFVRLEGSDRHARPSQVQLYTYNPSLVRHRARAATPSLHRYHGRCWRQPFAVWSLASGFLHSDMSGQIAATSPERGARLCLRGERTSHAQRQPGHGCESLSWRLHHSGLCRSPIGRCHAARRWVPHWSFDADVLETLRTAIQTDCLVGCPVWLVRTSWIQAYSRASQQDRLPTPPWQMHGASCAKVRAWNSYPG